MTNIKQQLDNYKLHSHNYELEFYYKGKFECSKLITLSDVIAHLYGGLKIGTLNKKNINIVTDEIGEIKIATIIDNENDNFTYKIKRIAKYGIDETTGKIFCQIEKEDEAND